MRDSSSNESFALLELGRIAKMTKQTTRELGGIVESLGKEEVEIYFPRIEENVIGEA